jgi:hypothetical protein
VPGPFLDSEEGLGSRYCCRVQTTVGPLLEIKFSILGNVNLSFGSIIFSDCNNPFGDLISGPCILLYYGL